jgi:wyosine [tRNA(Phe)-imidazoG37] synthetase (radical SAM superfamily)
MKYIYGPVQSRRLGLSLGITLTPHKACDFDCIYCQLGKTKSLICERKEYVAVSEVLEELRQWFENNPHEAERLSFITISGSGEPTLNINIGLLITAIKKMTDIPVSVITNSSLLWLEQVRKDISMADLIVPSLDAATEDVFRKIDRPQSQIKISDIIGGLVALRKEFKGKIWLEVMLVKGINDSIEHIRQLKEAIEEIAPDKVQLNSPERMTSEKGALAVGKNQLEKFKEILGGNCEII